ncbi:MAG: hypothetical protein J7L80_03615 [Thermoplasmata archaeon]|nr:hypothetical protein [Thermoplasmata archaeon]
MKVWQKILLLIATVIGISYFLLWWMSYEPMEIVIKNERDEVVNVSIFLLTVDGVEKYNGSFALKANESISLKNVTNMASSYYLKVIVNDSINETVKKKIKYGKYYEKIEVIIGKEKIEIRNERK